VVVEGYTDVIALHLAGMPIAVATCGTALGEEHLDLLRRFTERVVLMFDADEAGVGASLRGFERSVPGDLDLRVAALPLGRDPADVVAAGDTDAIRKSIESSAPLLQFRIERELEQYDLDDPAARARAVRAAAALAAAHPDELARADFSAYIERRVVTPPEGVRQLVEQLHRGAAIRPTPAAQREQLSGVEKAERDVLRLMLANDPGVRGQDFTELFSRRDHIEAYRRISPALEALEPGEEPDLGSLLGHDDSEPALLLKELALDPRPPGVADEVVTTVRVGALGRRIESLTRKVQAADQAADPDAYSAMLQELIALRREQHEMRSHE
jgi:DNA primase